MKNILFITLGISLNLLLFLIVIPILLIIGLFKLTAKLKKENDIICVKY